VHVLHVGQFVSADVIVLELGHEKREKIFFGFFALHAGQLSFEPSSPIG
jgi:hypothetical protein